VGQKCLPSAIRSDSKARLRLESSARSAQPRGRRRQHARRLIQTDAAIILVTAAARPRFQGYVIGSTPLFTVRNGEWEAGSIGIGSPCHQPRQGKLEEYRTTGHISHPCWAFRRLTRLRATWRRRLRCLVRRILIEGLDAGSPQRPPGCVAHRSSSSGQNPVDIGGDLIIAIDAIP